MEFMAALCAGAAVWFLMSDQGRLRALARPRRSRPDLPQWVPRLPRRAEAKRRERVQRELPETLELLAAALAAGLPPRVAASEVASSGPPGAGEALAQVVARVGVGVPEAEAWSALAQDPEWGDAAREMARSSTTGTGAVVTLRRLAGDARSRRRDALTRQARSVGVKAVGPLMGCYLPAFMLLGIVPIIAGLAQNMSLR